MPSRAYEDRIAGFRHSRHHALGNPANAIGVDHFQVRSVQGSLEAASQKGIEEPIVQRNLSLRMLFRRSAVAGHLACDFIGQLLIPWLASPSLCQFLAISAAPLPYSRSIVITLIMTSLACFL